MFRLSARDGNEVRRVRMAIGTPISKGTNCCENFTVLHYETGIKSIFRISRDIKEKQLLENRTKSFSDQLDGEKYK